MFNRVESNELPLIIPSEWTTEFKQTLLKLYGDKCIRDDRTFEIYAYTYPEEVLLIVSYVGMDEFSIPLTLFLSADLVMAQNPEKSIDTLSDSVGMFFDHYFSQTENQSVDEKFEDYNYEWEEEEIDNQKFYYKVTRENIGLTLKANELLGNL